MPARHAYGWRLHSNPPAAGARCRPHGRINVTEVVGKGSVSVLPVLIRKSARRGQSARAVTPHVQVSDGTLEAMQRLLAEMVAEGKGPVIRVQ